MYTIRKTCYKIHLIHRLAVIHDDTLFYLVPKAKHTSILMKMRTCIYQNCDLNNRSYDKPRKYSKINTSGLFLSDLKLIKPPNIDIPRL